MFLPTVSPTAQIMGVMSDRWRNNVFHIKTFKLIEIPRVHSDSRKIQIYFLNLTGCTEITSDRIHIGWYKNEADLCNAEHEKELSTNVKISS